MRKRLASIALALTLSIGMMPTAAWAEDDGISVQNIQGIAERETMFSANWIVGTDSNGGAQTVQRDITDKYFITAAKTEWNDRDFCYLVKDNVTIDGDVTVGDSVSLCLCDNATLTINGSVKINGTKGRLDIMGQSTGDKAGQMIVNNPDGNAFECLDSTSGTADIFMYSGRLTATGKDRALGKNVYLYKAENSSSNSTPILCVADGQKVRATASKTNPDEPHWSSNKGQSAFSAQSFTLQWCNHENEEWEYVKVDDQNHYKVRKWCNWHDGGAAGVESHNQETKPTADGKGHSGKCLCGYGSDQVEAHTWDTDGITCTVCNFKKAAHTSDGNLYDDVEKALAAESVGGTVTLEADVTAPITISSAVTLDLNGKTVTSLTVNDPAAKIKDSGKTKGTIAKLTAVDNGFKTTCEIAIGDNLLSLPWVKDLVRVNKAFIVERALSMRQMLMSSKRLSDYMHFAIKEKNENIWIAQREGRAKDSNDRTQKSILQMMSMGGEGSIIDRLKQLHLVPLSISYEYDPCDFLKAKEFQQKRDNADWKKGPMDDLVSMQTGIFGYKGHVHYHAAPCLDDYLDSLDPDMPKQDIYNKVAAYMDEQIFKNYRLYPGNYVALDLLENSTAHQAEYTAEDKAKFEKYMAGQLAKIDLPNKDEAYLRERILEMYANPVRNYLAAQ